MSEVIAQDRESLAARPQAETSERHLPRWKMYVTMLEKEGHLFAKPVRLTKVPTVTTAVDRSGLLFEEPTRTNYFARSSRPKHAANVGARYRVSAGTRCSSIYTPIAIAGCVNHHQIPVNAVPPATGLPPRCGGMRVDGCNNAHQSLMSRTASTRAGGLTSGAAAELEVRRTTNHRVSRYLSTTASPAALFYRRGRSSG